MLGRREFVFLLLFATAVLGAFLWPPMKPPQRSSLPAKAGIENADPDTDITGIVVDPEGRPVAGALVTSDISIWGRGPRSPARRLQVEAEGSQTVTAEDGTFVLPVGHGEIADLCVRPRSHGEAMIWGRRPGDHVRIQVTAGARLRIHVRDRNGAPVEDARVFVFTATHVTTGLAPRHSGVTDRHGNHVSPFMTAGGVRIRARKDGRWDSSFDIEIPASGDLGVTLDLTRPVSAEGQEGQVTTVEGRVTDHDGHPLENARVATSSGRGWTDARGRFKVKVGHFGTSRDSIVVWRPEYGRVSEERTDWTDFLEFRLPRGRRIAGRVLDPEGNPRPGIPVFLQRVEEEVAELALSDARGTFRFADVAAGEYWIGLDVILSGNAPATRLTIGESDDRTDVILKSLR